MPPLHAKYLFLQGFVSLLALGQIVVGEVFTVFFLCRHVPFLLSYAPLLSPQARQHVNVCVCEGRGGSARVCVAWKNAGFGRRDRRCCCCCNVHFASIRERPFKRALYSASPLPPTHGELSREASMTFFLCAFSAIAVFEGWGGGWIRPVQVQQRTLYLPIMVAAAAACSIFFSLPSLRNRVDRTY